MALLKGRFIVDSSVDGSKVKLRNKEPLKGKKADGSDKDIVQISEEGKIEFLDLPVVSQDPTSDDQLGRKSYVDSKAQEAKDYADQKVADEKAEREAGDAAIDSRLDSLEADSVTKSYVDQGVVEAKGYADEKVSGEKAEREAADQAIDSRIDALEADAVTKSYVDAGDQGAKDYADQKIADLVNSAPATLDTLKELADAIAAGETVSQGLLTLIGQTDDKIDEEVLNRQSADQVLDDKIDQEISDRQAGDAALQTALNTEVSDRASGDVVLDSKITQEKTERQAADAALQTALNTEVSARTAGDAALQAKLDASAYYHELHVNFDFTGTSDGSPYAPFKTIQAAVDAAAAQNIGANTAVVIHLKKNTAVSENVTINNAVANLYLTPAYSNNTDSSPIRIDGTLTIGGTSNRVRVKDIQFYNASSPALVINGGQGRHMFQNCQFSGGGGVSFTGSYQRWYEFVDCTIEGPMNIAGTPLAGTLISMYRPRMASSTLTVNAGNALVAMYDVYGMGGITHSSGTLAITGMWGWQAGAFNSTASSPSLLSLSNVSLQKTDLSFAKINKTGSALFQLKDVQRDEGQDVLSGTRIAFGSTLADGKFVPSVAASWSAASMSGKQALDEVMAKAKSVETGLASEVSARSSGDSALQTSLNSEISARQAGDAAEASARQAGDAAVQASVTALAGVVQGNFDLQQSDIDGLRTDIDAEQVARAAADTALDGKIETEKARIDAILSASEADKDSFAEIVQLINSVDTANDSAFASYVLSNNAALEAEQLARESADTALGVRIDGVQSDLAGEVTNRSQADAQLLTQVQAVSEQLDIRTAQIGQDIDAVEASLAQELVDRQAADASLSSRLDAFESDGASKAYVDGKIGNLEGNPDVATFVGQLATSVFTQITAEQTRAEAAESALDGRVTALEARPALRCQKQTFTMTAQNLADGYVDCAFPAAPMSMTLYVGGLVHFEEEDYMLSEVGGVTRITFMGDLVVPSPAALEEGDKVRVMYMVEVPVESGGGGGGGQPNAVIENVLLDNPTDTMSRFQIFWSGEADTYEIEQSDGVNWTLLDSGALAGSPTIIQGFSRPAVGEPNIPVRVRILSNGAPTAWFESMIPLEIQAQM